MAVLWEMLGNAGNNIYNASRDNADREQRRVASYQQYVASQAANANQARSIALEEQKYADQQNQLNSLKQGLTENAGNTQGIIDTLTAHGQAETAAQVAYTYSQVSKLNQEVSLKAEGIAMTKAFGALVAAPDELKDQVYGNIRNYLNKNYNVELPPELNTGVLMALGNLGAENNSTYQAMLSSPDMMRSVGSGLLESFTSEGQRRTNDVLGAMVGNAKQEKAHEQQLQERALRVQEGGLELKQQEFLAGRQDRAFDEGLEVAKLQQKATPKPKQYTQSTIQLMEYRNELLEQGASQDQISAIEAAISADIQGTAQGKGTTVNLTQDNGEMKLSSLVDESIKERFAAIEKARGQRIDIEGVRGALDELYGTLGEPGPGMSIRSAALKLGAMVGGKESNSYRLLNNLNTIKTNSMKAITELTEYFKPISDGEVKMIEKAVLSDNSTVAEIETYLNTIEKVYRRANEHQNALLDYADMGKSSTQFYRDWNKYVESTANSDITFNEWLEKKDSLDTRRGQIRELFK